jgi:hypothetical protein
MQARRQLFNATFVTIQAGMIGENHIYKVMKKRDVTQFWQLESGAREFRLFPPASRRNARRASGEFTELADPIAL